MTETTDTRTADGRRRSPDAPATAGRRHTAPARELAPPPPKKKSFSLMRARPARGRLNRRDRVRASIFAMAIRVVTRIILLTLRMRTVNEARLPDMRKLGPGPLIFALWHGDFIPVMHYARRSKVCVVVSRSPDGEILARILRAWGYRTVRGSNTRGGARAVIDLARVVGRGGDAAIAVDGPKGPRHVVKSGIVLLAKVTGCPIVPLGVGMSRFVQFRSWDRFRAPLPLCRAVVMAGDPVQVPADASDEELERKRVELEEAMLRLGDTAESFVPPERFAVADRPRGFTQRR